MKTTRGLIGFWACLIIGIAILILQGYKYGVDTLHLGLAELGLTIVAVVLIFAPKALSEAFGKLIDKHAGTTSTQAKDSIGGGGIKNPPPKDGNG